MCNIFCNFPGTDERARKDVQELIKGDTELGLLEKRMGGYLLSSRSPNTRKKYEALFKAWKGFANVRGITPIPASEFSVALYLTSLLDNSASNGTISSTAYAIKWVHSIKGHNFDINNPYIKGMMESARRLPKKKVNRKDPINENILIDICNKFKNSENLGVVRDLTIMVICFAGFLRYSEMAALKLKNVKIFNSHMELEIEMSKTDQYREGNSVCIARGVTEACPVRMLERYLRIAEIRDEALYLFRPLRNSKNGTKLILQNKMISYSRVRHCILEKLRTVESAKHLNIGLHSFRSGGASKAANADVNERCWKRHGRWVSDSSKDRYVLDKLEHKLEVTKQLGL